MIPAAARAGGLRVLLLYDTFFPETVGGVEHRDLELARELARRGHDVTLAAFGPAGPSPAPGVARLALGPAFGLYDAQGRRRVGNALTYARAAARLDLAGFDVVETASLPFAHLPPLAARCRLAGVPLLVTWHEFWGRYWRDYLGAPLWPLHAAFERACVGLGRAAIADSRLVAERVARRRGEAVEVVPVGVRVDAIAAAAATGAATGAAPLLSAGRLIPDKRIDLLIEAVARLTPRFPGRLLDIVGDGPERSRLEALAGRLGVAGAVRFRGRLAGAAEVWAALGGAQVAVQPSRREGFGIFPLEAMAAGLPVVRCESAESAVGELVEHERHGLATPPDPERLAAALARLLGDAAERARFGAAARERARRYDWSVVVLDFEPLLARLARPGGGLRAARRSRA